MAGEGILVCLLIVVYLVVFFILSCWADFLLFLFSLLSCDFFANVVHVDCFDGLDEFF